MPTISVIIPAYNVEKYLDKCMNSVLNQSFTDFEVLRIQPFNYVINMLKKILG